MNFILEKPVILWLMTEKLIFSATLIALLVVFIALCVCICLICKALKKQQCMACKKNIIRIKLKKALLPTYLQTNRHTYGYVCKECKNKREII